MKTYEEFLKGKRVTIQPGGFEIQQEEVHPLLFDWQGEIVRWALRLGRAAIFAECGLGKTLMQVEWARLLSERVGGRFLFLAPLAVASQTIREGQRLGVGIVYCQNQAQADQAASRFIITNYDRLKDFDGSKWTGVILDESSILKSFMGQTKRLILDMFRLTRFKLACTATPAPNDHLELGNHAEFLGLMPSNEMIMRWFINHAMQAGNYRLKKHAEADFWRWVTSWAVCISKPSDLGYSDEGFELPPLNLHEHRIDVDHTRAWDSGRLFLDGKSSATGLWSEKKMTLEDRMQKTVELVASAPDRPWIVWTDTNDEADALKALLPKDETVEVRGSDKLGEKERKLNAFSNGEARVIVTKPEIAGLGLNWQHCADMVFVGATFSYERIHQALRRSYRFRQTRPVNAHLVVAETEANVLSILKQKQKAFQEMQEKMNEAQKLHGLFGGGDRRVRAEYRPGIEMVIPSWLVSKEVA